jgi:hypothetical protein
MAILATANLPITCVEIVPAFDSRRLHLKATKPADGRRRDA